MGVTKTPREGGDELQMKVVDIAQGETFIVRVRPRMFTEKSLHSSFLKEGSTFDIPNTPSSSTLVADRCCFGAPARPDLVHLYQTSAPSWASVSVGY